MAICSRLERGVHRNLLEQQGRDSVHILSTEGGHSILGTMSAQHQLSQRWSMEFGYTRLVQIYSGIPVVSRAPYTNREFVSFSYHFARPLGG